MTSVTVAHNPFEFNRTADVCDVEGASLWQIMHRHGLSEDNRAHVFVNGELVPRAEWDDVRPSAGSHVDVRVLPTGGGGDNKAMRTVLTIAVIAVSIYAPYAMGIAGTWQGAAVSAAISYAGTFAVNQLVPPATPELDEGGGKKDSPNFAIEGARNRANPFGVLPQALGTKRVYPPYAAQPYTELEGDEQWLRMLFDLSYGPVEVSGLRIGETSLSEFSDYEVSVNYGDGNGWSQGNLYPNTANQDNYNILLENSSGYVVRTTDPDIDEISVDVTATSLIGFNDTGDKLSRTVDVEVQYAPTGTTRWSNGADGTSYVERDISLTDWYDGSTSVATGQYAIICMRKDDGTLFTLYGFVGLEFNNNSSEATIPAVPDYAWGIARVFEGFSSGNPDSLTDIRSDTLKGKISSPGDFAPTGDTTQVTVAAGSYENIINIIGKTTSAVRRNVRFPVPRGQYDVRVRRITPDSTSDNVRDEVFWTALRTFVDEDPVNADGRAMVALRIKASDQLNGIIDRFNCVVTPLIDDWDGTQWVASQPSNNPASIYRHVLQGSANKKALADSRIDLDGLAYWHELCDARGQQYANYVDYKTTLGQLLREIASAGRATPSIVDGGKHGVVADEEKTTVVQHFTPRNTWGFSSGKQFRKEAHAVEVRFANAAKDWRQDSVTVYRDGYSESNATRVESLELVGITNSDHAYSEGRYYLAVETLRPETYTFNADIEHIVCTRGDLIRMTHDVPLWGLDTGRIKSVTTDGNGDVTHITVDETITMQSGTNYAVRIRLSDGATVVRSVVTSAGDQHTLELATPIGTTPLPAKGDLAQFGEAGSESVELIVWGIEPGQDMSAKITAKDHAPAVHDVGTIPAFDSQVTDTIAEIAPSIRYVQVDETNERHNADGVLITDLEVRLDPQLSSKLREVTGLEVQYRTAGTDQQWVTLPTYSTQTTSVTLSGLQQGFTYLVRARYLYAARSGPWSSTHTVTNGLSETREIPSPHRVQIAGQDNDQEYTGRSATIVWDPPSVRAWHQLGFEPEDQGAGAGGVDLYFSHYDIEVIVNDQLVNTYKAQDERFTYDYERNSLDNGTAQRAYTLKIYTVGRQGQRSDPAFITINNPAPELTTVEVSPQFNTATVRLTRPDDLDFDKFKVWVGSTSGFTRDDSTLVSEGPDNSITVKGLDDGTTYYLRYQPFDGFGPGTESSEIAFTTNTAADVGWLGQWAEIDIGTRTQIEEWLEGTQDHTTTFAPIITAGQIVSGVVQATELIETEGLIRAVDDINNPTWLATLGPESVGGTVYLLNYRDSAGNLTFGLDAAGGFEFQGDGDNYIQWDGSTLTIRGDLDAGDITSGGTITGNTLQTAASGKRFVVSKDTNEAEFYGDRGDGTIQRLAAIGIDESFTNSVVALFGGPLVDHVAIRTSTGGSSATSISGFHEGNGNAAFFRSNRSGTEGAPWSDSGVGVTAMRESTNGNGGAAFYARTDIDVFSLMCNGTGGADSPTFSPSADRTGLWSNSPDKGSIEDGAPWWWTGARWNKLTGLIFARLTNAAAHTVNAGDIEPASDLRYSNGFGTLVGGTPPGTSYMCLGHAHTSSDGGTNSTLWIQVD